MQNTKINIFLGFKIITSSMKFRNEFFISYTIYLYWNVKSMKFVSCCYHYEVNLLGWP